MKRPIYKGERYGRCNICSEQDELSYDHVPPKGSIDIQRVWVRSLIHSLEPENKNNYVTLQNGLKFRSLCKNCNNSLLGTKYDPSLNHLSRKFGQILHIQQAKRVILPENISLKIQPQRIARAIVGHLLAAEIRDDMRQPPRDDDFQTLQRRYFLDEKSDFPESFNLFLWPYLSSKQKVLKSIMLGTFSMGNVYGDLLKFFPLAFWLTFDATASAVARMNAYELHVRGKGIDEWATISIFTSQKSTFSSNWPEYPDNSYVTCIAEGMTYLTEVDKIY